MTPILLNLLGLIGAGCFGAACLPMAWKALRTGTSVGVPTSSIWLFLTACVTFFGYLWMTVGFRVPFLIGIVETVCWLIVAWYHFFPRGFYRNGFIFPLNRDANTTWQVWCCRGHSRYGWECGIAFGLIHNPPLWAIRWKFFRCWPLRWPVEFRWLHEPDYSTLWTGREYRIVGARILDRRYWWY